MLQAFHMRRIVLLLLLIALPASASAKLVQKDGKAAFEATGPGGLQLNGKAKSLAFEDTGEKLVWKIQVADVDTGIGLRNKHMRDKYVKVKEHPEATLEVARADVKFETGEHTVQGTFTLKGVSKPVEVKYRLAKAGSGYAVEASFPFDVRDHGIDIPNYLGVTVDPKMKATAVIRATEE